MSSPPRRLDASALVAFASGRSIYAAALVWTAVEEGLVLAVPSSAIAAAWGELTEKDHPVLEVLLRLPVTVVENLDQPAAREVGARVGDVVDAHAVHCAARRGWPLVTADAARYSGTGTAGVEIEQLA
jgi:predicted nucleic acid-binding protein